MKAPITALAFILSTALLMVAQTAANSTGQSTTPPEAQAIPSQSGDGGAIQFPSASPANAWLQAKIENALRNEPALSNSHVAVNVTDDSINLSGTVGSSKDKTAAERIAQSFDGNRKLNDTLAVTGHGHSCLAPDHSAMNNSGTGNMQNPATGQGSSGSNAPPPTTPPQR